METGLIDYEALAHDPLWESDPRYAAAQLEAIGEQLERLTEKSHCVGACRIRTDCRGRVGRILADA